MEPTTNKWLINLRNLYKMESAHVILYASAAAAWYASLPALNCESGLADCLTRHDVDAFIRGTLHIPAWIIPTVIGLAGLIARIRPSKSISGAEAVAKSADTPQPPTT